MAQRVPSATARRTTRSGTVRRVQGSAALYHCVHAVVLLQTVTHSSASTRQSGACARGITQRMLPCIALLRRREGAPGPLATTALCRPGRAAGHQAQLQQLGLVGECAAGPVQHAQVLFAPADWFHLSFNLRWR